MANVTFDKKQLPQVVGLGALSACTFGYFALKMISPPASNAAAPAATTAAGGTDSAGSATGNGSGSGSAASTGDVDSVDPAALIGASAPTDAMRDPFAMPTAASAAKASGGSVKTAGSPPSALPDLAALTSAKHASSDAGSGGVQPLPGAQPALPISQAAPAPAAPQVVSPATQWSVSGVICSDVNPSLSLAIFRSGNTRRYVRVGEWLDSATQLVKLSRSDVEVVRSGMRFRLTLGTAPEAPGLAQQPPAAAAASPAPVPMSVPSAPQPALPQQTSAVPPSMQPAQAAAPTASIASAVQPEYGQVQLPQSPVEKVAASVEIATSAAPPDASISSSAPRPADADSPATGAMDVPTFNGDLFAPAPDCDGLLAPASWTSQAGLPPLTSVLLSPDQSSEQGDQASLQIDSASPLGTDAMGLPQTLAQTPPEFSAGGFGMKLMSTPSSVLSALGLDSALFAPQAQPVGSDADAMSLSSAAIAPAESIFAQFDSVTGADMARIACGDDTLTEGDADQAAMSASGTVQNVASLFDLSAWSAGSQQDFERVFTEFNS